jgi:hemerythrin-like metal-binding protein/putative nucleotidyltransferase with HDIG domain
MFNMVSPTDILWENIPRINLENFDEDHEKIIKIINVLLRSRSGNITEREFRSAVSRLMIYTSSHFKREEIYLRENNYPDLRQHIEDHFRLTRTLLSIKKTIIEGGYKESISTEIEDFLKNKFIVEHMTSSDVSYANYFAAKQLQQNEYDEDSDTSDEIKQSLEAQLQALDDFDDDVATTVEIPQKDFTQEISIASDAKFQAQDSVKAVLQDIAADRPVKHEKIADSSALLLNSFKRNTSALLALALLEDKEDSIIVHSVKVATYLIAFCKIMGFDEHTTINIGMGGMLHDIGKSRATSKVSDSESKHVKDGREMLEAIPGFPEEVIIIASQHHERIDGSGFPNKLIGDKIQTVGQMAGIANLFDKLTSQRPNQEPMAPNVAFKHLLGISGTQFDPELIQKFIKAIGIHPVGTTVELQDGSIAVVAENDPDSLLLPVVNVVYDKNGEKNDELQQIDLKKEKTNSNLQIKRVAKVKHKGFDPLDALLALRSCE